MKDFCNSLYYSLFFDESWNLIVWKCQMDVIIRYWDNKENKGKFCCLDSLFLESLNADNVLQILKTAVKDLKEESILKFAKKGLNVNWDKLDVALAEEGHTQKKHSTWGDAFNMLLTEPSRLLSARQQLLGKIMKAMFSLL